ncbi:MAG: hypothetical protein ACOWWR_19470, partial [Eubacteriales bacterium]
MDVFKLNDNLLNYNDNIGIVLGAYVNSLHIIRNLGSKSIPVVCISKNKDGIGKKSKYTSQFFNVDYVMDEKELFRALILIGKQLNKPGVLYPTADEHVQVLTDHYSDLSKYYYIAVNPDNNEKVTSKEYQYKLCDKIGVDYPQSFYLKSEDDIENLYNSQNDIQYPLIIKPFSKVDVSQNLFRVKEIHNKEQLRDAKALITDNIKVGFLVSEIIPGEPNQLWTYGSYCSENSEVVAGFSGKKLTQRPYYFGVFSTARYEKNERVEEQSKKLLKAINHVGLSQVEFKYDYRDDKYKLMEINPRYWMWHGVGIKDNMSLALVHYYHITGKYDELNKLNLNQNSKTATIVFMATEFFNILDNKPRRKFIKNFFKSLLSKN